MIRYPSCFQHDFSKKYKEEIRKYGMMQRYDDSLQFLQERPHLVCEETANYLVIWCIDLEVEEVSCLCMDVDSGYVDTCCLYMLRHVLIYMIKDLVQCCTLGLPYLGGRGCVKL